MNKIERSIELIRKAEPLALQYSPDGFHLAFSGGKDSMVIYELAKMAGVKFKAHMQVTTIDPPELMKFVRKNYPDVELHRPELNFYKLIVKKGMLPNQIARYCCQYLKERGGEGTVTILGIRRQESIKRGKRNEFEISGHKYSNTLDQFNIDSESKVVCVNGKDKIMLSPILNWTNSEVWNFIRERGLEYCSMYDEGYHRIGCIFCPMQSKRHKSIDRTRYPGIERNIKKSIKVLMEKGKYPAFENEDDVFDWWVSGVSTKEYLAQKNQTKINFDEMM